MYVIVTYRHCDGDLRRDGSRKLRRRFGYEDVVVLEDLIPKLKKGIRGGGDISGRLSPDGDGHGHRKGKKS
jgi:hypothetical protein